MNVNDIKRIHDFIYDHDGRIFGGTMTDQQLTHILKVRQIELLEYIDKNLKEISRKHGGN
jgi:hypothetical protein